MTLPVALFDRLQQETIGPRESVLRELTRLFDACALSDHQALGPWGVPEWRGINAGDDEAVRRFCRQFRDAILRAEPRITALNLQVVSCRYQEIQLRLEASLWHDDFPLQLVLGYRQARWKMARFHPESLP